MENIEIKKIDNAEELALAYKIRKDIFVVEQEVDESLEFEFEDESTHFLLYFNNIPIGTSRYRQTDYGYKIERFAIVKEYRGKGFGKELLKFMLNELKHFDKKIYLHAQIQVVVFYQKYGFEKIGDEFVEATIRHHKMAYQGG